MLGASQDVLENDETSKLTFQFLMREGVFVSRRHI